jgi:hypothetical protein
MTLGGRRRRRALVTAATTLVAGLVLAPAAHAEEGLGERGTTRYVVSDKGTPVKVTQTFTVTNEQPPTATRYFFWTGYPLWLPNGASDLRATSNGSTLPVKRIRLKDLDYADISFPSPLNYGRSRTVTVTYTIPGAKPRSSSPGRVGKGYAAFDVYSPGGTGQATIEVVAPRWMNLDLGIHSTDKTTGDTRTTTATGGGDLGLWSMVSLRDPSQVDERRVTVKDNAFDVVAFPGDTVWSTYISNQLPQLVPALERITGQGWPGRTTRITEDFSRQVYGWDGTYKQGAIEVSEATDPAILAHELAHAWANSDNTGDRWLIEGLAQELARQAVTSTKQKDEDHRRVSPSGKGAFPLATWPDGDGVAGEAEDYGYPASYAAVHALVSGSKAVPGPRLMKALTSRATLYDAPGERPVVNHATTWKQAYDLFEVLGGNTSTKALMTDWVIAPADAKLLTVRAKTRTEYAAAERVDGDWRLPRGVRSAMADWDFSAASLEIARTKSVATAALSAQQAAAKAHVDTKAVQAAYQSASGDDYVKVRAQLEGFSRVATDYADQRSDWAARNPLARVGGLLADPGADLARARADLAAGKPGDADKALSSAQRTSTLATAAGAGAVLLALLILVGVVLALRLRRRRRIRSVTTSRPAGATAPEREHDGAPWTPTAS